MSAGKQMASIAHGRVALLLLAMRRAPTSVGVCCVACRALAHRIPENASINYILHAGAWVRARHIRYTSRTITTNACRVPILDFRHHIIHTTILQKSAQRIHKKVWDACVVLCRLCARAARDRRKVAPTPWGAGSTVLSLVRLKACPRSAQRFKGSCWT